MNKVFSTALVMLMVLVTGTARAGVYNGNCGANGNNVTWNYDLNSGVLTIEGSGDMADFDFGNIPWKDFSDDIEEIVVSAGVTSIGETSFYHFSNVTSVTLPDGLKKIGTSAFVSCTGIQKIKIPSTVSELGSAFSDCSSLRSIVIPEGITNIEMATFMGCVKLASVTLPSTLKSIEDEAFSGCEKLTSIILPASLETMSVGTFSCVNLTSITCEAVNPPKICMSFYNVPTNKATLYVPYESVDLYKNANEWADFTNILPIPGTGPQDSYAGNCGANGDNVTWSFDPDSGVLNIEGNGAMANFEYENTPWQNLSEEIKSVVVGAGVTTIGQYSFAGLTSVTSVSLPEGLTTISEGAFSACSKLTDINIPSTVTTIEDGTFNSCKSLESFVIPEGVTEIGQFTFAFDDNLASVTIPNTVTIIGVGAFNRCTALTSITLPASVTKVSEGSFEECSNLRSITCEAETPAECSNMVFGSDIENNATLYVPYGSIDLYKNADGWVGFTNILPIPGTGPQDEIVSGTCGMNDDNLTWTLNITKGILSIEGSGDMQNFSAYAISPWSNYRNDVKELIIAEGVTSIGNSAFAGFSNLTEITIPSSVTSIGDSPFASCSGIKEAIIVNDMFVKMPESYAGSYTIPNGIATIIAGACSDCSELTSVTLPEGLTTVGEEAFIRCSKLAEINIPTSVTNIGKNAFAYCKALTTADIPESVTTIKRGTFADSGITSVTLPSTITNIMMSAFSNCENLTTVTCWATEPPFTNGAFDGVPTDNGTLFVPYEALEAYKSAPEWMDWADIQAIPSTAIRDLRLSVPAIKTLNHGTILITTHGKTYTASGTERK